jgi:hypothetical protein
MGNRGKKNLKYFIIALLIVVAGEFLAKYITFHWREQGIWIQDGPYHPYFGYKPRPYSKYRFGGHCPYPSLIKYSYIQTDEHSRSLTPFSPANPIYKIAVTGGGSVFGAGSSSEQTSLPSWLEIMVHEELSESIDVINISVPGHQSFQEMLVLSDYLKENKVDLVISASGLNDAGFAYEEDDIRSSSIGGEVRDRASVINDNLSLNNYLRSISYGYDLVFVVSTKLLRKFRDFLADPVDNPRDAVMSDDRGGDVYKNIPKRAALSSLHYSMMNTMAENSGSKFMMVLIPTAFTKAELTPFEKSCAESRVTRDVRLSNNILRIYEGKFYDWLHKLPKSYQYHDLRGSLDGSSENMYIDLNHYNDAGARGVARAVFEIIKPTLKEAISSAEGDLKR